MDVKNCQGFGLQKKKGPSHNKLGWPFFYILFEDINSPLHNLLRKQRQGGLYNILFKSKRAIFNKNEDDLVPLISKFCKVVGKGEQTSLDLDLY